MVIDIVICEHHHHALSAWAQLRQTLAHAPRLITLDHHTDTSPPFRTWLKENPDTTPPRAEELKQAWLADLASGEPAKVDSTIAKLNNDEHIVGAIQSGLIRDALVLAHHARDTGIEIYQRHSIICRSVDEPPYSKIVPRALCDRVLERFFLDERLKSFDSVLKTARQPQIDECPYILDIDLDYFNTKKAISPNDPSTFLELLRGASLITIATEPAFVTHCALDSALTSEKLLARFLLWVKHGEVKVLPQ